MNHENTTAPDDMAPRTGVELVISGDHEMTFTSLTRDDLLFWVTQLDFFSNPFLVLSRPGIDNVFIQTLLSGNEYTLDVRTGPSDHQQMYAELRDPDTVTQLLWDWISGDWHRLNELTWTNTF
ncbi:hypothetical protein ACFVUS_05825 [Nocardia sp. NPDC058058]|uniref:hypothetical protein n=1 Tax=Nocardia sp. NPDC058058 TaxID=3346317 RepID=UPI0036D8C828